MAFTLKFGIIPLLLACAISAKSVPESTTPQLYDVIEGENLTVVCNTNKTDEAEVFWVKYDTGAHTNVYQNGTDLEFLEITRSSSGTYLCLLQNDNLTKNVVPLDEVKINVLYPAEITGFNITPTVLVEYNFFGVFCNVTGNPTPEFVITDSRTRHVSVDYKASASMKVYNEASCESQATWICTGRNYLNKVNVTLSANVTVFCAPRADKRMDTLSRVKARVGESVPLKMVNWGNPYPKYTWSHNGMFFPNDSHKDYGYASVLQIDNVQVEDFGRYYVDMINDYGFERWVIELVPDGPPEKPYNLEISEITHNSANLRWTSGFDMGSPQYFLVLRYDGDGSMGGYYTYPPYLYDTSSNHGVGAQHEFIATDMWSDSPYAFAIVAQNDFKDDYGWPVSVFSDKALVRTKVAPPSTTPLSPPNAGLYRSVGFRVGIPAGAGLLLVSLVAIIVVVCQRNKKDPYSVLREKKIRPIPNIYNQPLQLGISSEMKKQVLT